jgi:hypothetical protein
MAYNPTNWYWAVAGSTTQVFSSASGTYVPVSDPTYVNWLAVYNMPTAIGTEADLIAVLAVQAPDVVMQSTAGLISYANAKQTVIMNGGTLVSVGNGVVVECSTDPASLILLQGAATIAASTPGATFNWVPKNSNPITLVSAQMTAMFAAVTAFLQASFTTLGQVITAINAGTITTKAAIDTPPSPIPTWPVNS